MTEYARILAATPDIADEYDIEATYQKSVPRNHDRWLWQGFGVWLDNEAYRLRHTYHVLESHSADPYGSAADMFHDLDEGVFVVSRANCEHPVWSPATNVSFRIWHDICGHYAIRKGFSYENEVEVYLHALRHTPPEFHPALFTESISQAAYAHVHGDFHARQVIFQSVYRTLEEF